MSGPARIDLDEARGMWLAGYRYRAIAEHFGVSRQAVEQMRDRCPEFFPARDWMTLSQAAKATSVWPPTVARWIAEGLLETSPDGLVRAVDVEAVIVELWTRQCEYPGCAHDVEGIEARRRFCPEHTIETQRYHYPVKSPAARQRHNEAVARWEAKNPEKAREIQRRAMRAFRERQREKAS